MGNSDYDVIVIGLGGMGSAAAYHLAARGQRVLGLERFRAAHSNGSSHGESRIIRLAYFEDPAYVPLLRRSYDLWRRLERDAGKQLLMITGGLMMGPPESEVVSGSIRSAREHDLPHEILDASAIRRRFPPFQPDADVVALYESVSGVLFPEETILAHLKLAARHGAELRFEEPAVEWRAAGSGEGVRVQTPDGTYEAAQLVVAPGAWAPALLAELTLPIQVERQLVFWLDPIGGAEPFLPERFPIYIWEDRNGVQIYGFPAQNGPGGGVKVAFYGPGVAATPETIGREIHPAEIAAIRRHVAAHIPALAGECVKAQTCMFVNTPDQHFVIAVHPAYPQVSFAAGLCGHGYKFASVVGEILADLATQGATSHPIGLFSPGRFA